MSVVRFDCNSSHVFTRSSCLSRGVQRIKRVAQFLRNVTESVFAAGIAVVSLPQIGAGGWRPPGGARERGPLPIQPAPTTMNVPNRPPLCANSARLVRGLSKRMRLPRYRVRCIRAEKIPSMGIGNLADGFVTPSDGTSTSALFQEMHVNCGFFGRWVAPIPQKRRPVFIWRIL